MNANNFTSKNPKPSLPANPPPIPPVQTNSEAASNNGAISQGEGHGPPPPPPLNPNSTAFTSNVSSNNINSSNLGPPPGFPSLMPTTQTSQTPNPNNANPAHSFLYYSQFFPHSTLTPAGNFQIIYFPLKLFFCI